MVPNSGHKHGVQGDWFGNYYYANVPQAFGFEAVFIELDGAVQGSILDDGNLGEAQVAGTFSHPDLSFKKSYRQLAPVSYTGVLSDDGKQLTGQWIIDATTYGTWTAWRVDEEEDADTFEEDAEVDQGKPLTAVLPA